MAKNSDFSKQKQKKTLSRMSMFNRNTSRLKAVIVWPFHEVFNNLPLIPSAIMFTQQLKTVVSLVSEC